MPASRDQVIDRLRKLLSKTTANGATEAEAQTALAMAQRLMDEHRLDAAEVRAAGDAGAAGVVHADAHESRYSELHYRFAMGVAEEAFGVVVLEVGFGVPGTRRRVGHAYRVFGAPADVEAATWGLHFLATTFKALWGRFRVAAKAPACDRDGYYQGLADGFLFKLSRERARLELDRPGSGTELATLASRVRDEVGRLHPGARAIVKNVRPSDAYDAGFDAGRMISLARPVGHDAARAAIPAR